MNVPTAPVAPAAPSALDLAEAAGLPLAEVFERLAGSEAGLTEAQAAQRLTDFGPNVLPTRPVTALGIP